MTSIILYTNGECKSEEFIEDNYCAFKNDGTIHYVEFIEGDTPICLKKDGLYTFELLERSLVCLTNEYDLALTDEFGNCLTAII